MYECCQSIGIVSMRIYYCGKKSLKMGFVPVCLTEVSSVVFSTKLGKFYFIPLTSIKNIVYMMDISLVFHFLCHMHYYLVFRLHPKKVHSTVHSCCHFSIQLRVENNRFYTVLSWKLKHRKNNRYYTKS